MVFSSVLFVFQFLPAALILYYISPKKLKNFTLFLVSIIFYSWGEVRYFPIMLALILTNYFCARAIAKFDDEEKKRKFFLILSIVVSLGMLAVFKYTNFFIENVNALLGVSIPLANITLPLGISFYTFQTMAYTIDVYRRTVPVEKNFINVGAFIVMFPQLIAGPIVRYTDIHKELHERTITPEALGEGMEDFVIGLAKKVLLANNIGMLWTEVESIGFGAISTGLAWLGILAFSLQIYFDFSGYSQMAIGMGKMLGFNFPKNFDMPYTSRSVGEFWRRWHMTLGSWFREYVYFPLGGSRRGKWRTVLNLFIVWALTGLWHGASWNFVCWGLYFFVLLVLERTGFKRLLNSSKVFSRLYMILILLVGWALFAITDFSELGIFLTRMFVPTNFFPGSATVGVLYYLRNYAFVIAIGCFVSTNLSTRLYGLIKSKKALHIAVLLVLFLICVAYLVDSTYNPFLYFRF